MWYKFIIFINTVGIEEVGVIEALLYPQHHNRKLHFRGSSLAIKQFENKTISDYILLKNTKVVDQILW